MTGTVDQKYEMKHESNLRIHLKRSFEPSYLKSHEILKCKVLSDAIGCLFKNINQILGRDYVG